MQDGIFKRAFQVFAKAYLFAESKVEDNFKSSLSAELLKRFSSKAGACLANSFLPRLAENSVNEKLYTESRIFNSVASVYKDKVMSFESSLAGSGSARLICGIKGWFLARPVKALGISMISLAVLSLSYKIFCLCRFEPIGLLTNFVFLFLGATVLRCNADFGTLKDGSYFLNRMLNAKKSKDI